MVMINDGLGGIYIYNTCIFMTTILILDSARMLYVQYQFHVYNLHKLLKTMCTSFNFKANFTN